MDKKEYYKQIERINNRFKTDRVSADEEYQLVCQRNYLSTKYIEHLEQQCKKQKEVIDRVNKYLHTRGIQKCYNGRHYRGLDGLQVQVLEDILKEVSE